MTNKEFIKEISEVSGLTIGQAETFLESFKEVLVVSVKDNLKHAIPGLGTFKVVERAARKGINPKTKEPLYIKASTSMSFKIAPSLKKTFN